METAAQQGEASQAERQAGAEIDHDDFIDEGAEYPEPPPKLQVDNPATSWESLEWVATPSSLAESRMTELKQMSQYD